MDFPDRFVRIVRGGFKMKPLVKNALMMLIIVGGGFALFMAAFSLAAAVMGIVGRLTGTMGKPPYIAWPIYLVIILVISWFVFRSKLPDLAKATYLTLPLMIAVVFEAILLYEQSQWLILGVGAVIVCAVLLFLYIKKLSWLYYFATLYVAVLGMIILFTGVEI